MKLALDAQGNIAVVGSSPSQERSANSDDLLVLEYNQTGPLLAPDGFPSSDLSKDALSARKERASALKAARILKPGNRLTSGQTSTVWRRFSTFTREPIQGAFTELLSASHELH